jgi:hypothetical protein
VAGFRKYGSLDLVLARSLSSNLHSLFHTYFRQGILFAFEGEASIPLAVKLGIDENVLVVKNSLAYEKTTVQFNLVGTQAAFFESSSMLSSMDPSIIIIIEAGLREQRMEETPFYQKRQNLRVRLRQEI